MTMRLIKYLYFHFWMTVTYFMPDMNIFCRVRGWLVRPACAKVGKRFGITHDVKITFTCNCEFGDDVFLANGVYIHGRGGVKMGNGVRLGPYTVILSVQRSHTPNKGEHGEAPRQKMKETVLEDNVYVGAHAVILAGVRVGQDSVITPNCVISRKLPPGSMVVAPIPKVIKLPS